MSHIPLIWGAWRARSGADTATPAGLARFLGAALDAGVSRVDVADIYDDGAVETLLGEALARDTALKTGFRIVGKTGVRFASAGQPGVTVAHYRSDAAHLRAQADASLTRLGVERLDQLLLHRPDYLMDAEETAGVLDALIAEGKIAAAGVSNFSASQVELLTSRLKAPFAAHQLEFSPLYDTPLDDGTLDQAQRLAFEVQAWSPLGGGRLFSGDDAVAARVRAALETVAAAHDTDLAGAALAWVARHPSRPVPILGTCSAARLAAQADAVRRVTLDAPEWYAVLEAARGERVP